MRSEVKKVWGNYDKRGKWKRQRESIDEIAYANGEEGTLNAYMCVQGTERAKNWSQCVCLQNGWTPTVSLKDIPESLILKIHNIVDIVEDTQYCWHACQQYCWHCWRYTILLTC